MWDTLLAAMGLMLIFEGLLPLMNPAQWRALFSRILQFSDGQLRSVGLMSVAAGLLTLWWVG